MNKTSSPSFQNTKKQILYTHPTKKTKNKKKTSLQLNDTDIYIRKVDDRGQNK